MRQQGPKDAAFEAKLLAFDLVSWLESAGFVNGDRMGKELVQDCPWCGKEGKFSVNPKKRQWRCFVCRRSADLIDIIAAFEGSYKAAMELVLGSSRYRKIPLDRIDDPGLVVTRTREERARPVGWEPSVVEPPRSFVPLAAHIPYTAQRNFPMENVIALGVGHCIAGWQQDRVVFPVFREDGSWIYYQGRATWPDHQDLGGVKRYRKSLNLPANDDVAGSADVLMGLHLAMVYAAAGYPIAVVEGPTDLVQAGPAAVALLGRVVSDYQLGLFARSGIRVVDVMLDPDAWSPPPGRSKTPAVFEVAARIASVVPDVRLVRLPDGWDPGSMDPGSLAAYRSAAQPLATMSRLARI